MAPSQLLFPPKDGMDTLTPILDESSALGIHPGLRGPDPERGQLGLGASQVPHSAVAGHPTGAGGRSSPQAMGTQLASPLRKLLTLRASQRVTWTGIFSY